MYKHIRMALHRTESHAIYNKKMYAEPLNQEFTKSDQSAIRIDKRRVYY